MKKNLFILITTVLLLCLTEQVYAMQPYEISSRQDKCLEKFEVAEALTDGNLSKIACFESYEEAYQKYITEQNDNLVIIESDVIVMAKYSFVDYDSIDNYNSSKGYIDVYVDKNSNNTNGYYIRSSSPDEAAVLEIDYATKRVKIKVAGLVGWINKYEGSTKLYDIIPLAWAKTTQYYKVNNNSFEHHFPGNIYGTKGEYKYTIDQKPTVLNEGIYYSYDGNYFYTDLKLMLSDYMNNNYNNSVNKDKPYYNYYQYLSLRTETNYTKENIDSYISNRTSDKSSVMLNTGTYFMNSQTYYGINPIIMMAIGRNESTTGTSPIAKSKNNLFGLNAVDKTPGESANYFKTVEDCINDYGYVWLNYGYGLPGDSRFKGANLGNKSQGMNYRYASDPFWAEKAAAFYYDMDKMYSFQDYNIYQLAVLNDNYNNVVYAKKTPGGENVSSSYYQYRVKNSPIVILEEVEGPSVNGNTTWYKIMSDAPLDENKNYIGDSKSNPRVIYNRVNSTAYVSAAYFTKINDVNLENRKPLNENVPTQPPKEEKPQEETKPTVEEVKVEYKKISSIIEEANYKHTDNIIYGIKLGTNVDEIKNNLTSTGGVIKIVNANGKNASGTVATGMKISITSGQTEEYTVLISGDTDGDSEISAVDYVRVKNSIMGTLKLEGIYEKAADVNSDGVVDAVDYVNIKNYIMGKKNVISN